MLGILLEKSIRGWLQISGKKIHKSEYEWLNGPVANPGYIGDQYFQNVADAYGFTVEKPQAGGLTPDFDLLHSGIHGNRNQKVKDFYERTSLYQMEAWSQWYFPMSLFAKGLIKLVSRRINQLNIPLEPLDTSRGMSSEVIYLKNKSGKPELVCWLRKSVLTGKVIYAGFYSVIKIGAESFVRVIFPLPKGNATVILKPEFQSDGSFKLFSHGNKIGDAGYYRIQQDGAEHLRVKRIPIKEIIHVYEDDKGILRTDHEFWFLGFKLLKLHYKLGLKG